MLIKIQIAATWAATHRQAIARNSAGEQVVDRLLDCLSRAKSHAPRCNERVATGEINPCCTRNTPIDFAQSLGASTTGGAQPKPASASESCPMNQSHTAGEESRAGAEPRPTP